MPFTLPCCRSAGTRLPRCVWAHAYYIDYRNARPKFIEVVLANLVNWDFVSTNLDGKGVARANQT